MVLEYTYCLYFVFSEQFGKIKYHVNIRTSERNARRLVSVLIPPPMTKRDEAEVAELHRPSLARLA